MNSLKIVLLLLMVLLGGSFSKKQLFPFSRLHEKKELILKKGKAPNSYVDTLNAQRIEKLATLQFEQGNSEFEQIGVTPDYSIDIYDKGNRICLIGVWGVIKGKVALNINYFTQDNFIHGVVIDREKFESVFDFKR